MRILTFQFVGTTPLLLHHIDKHQFRSQLASKSELGKSFDDEAYEVMVKDSDGNPAVPVSWFRDAIKVGCSKILVEGKQVSFLKVSSAMRIKPDDFLPLKRVDGQAPEWQVYKSVQHAAPGSNTMIVVVAPEFREWKFEVEISCYLEFPPSDLLVRLLTEAGKSGIGLFHPPKKQFGQFRISS